VVEGEVQEVEEEVVEKTSLQALVDVVDQEEEALAEMQGLLHLSHTLLV